MNLLPSQDQLELVAAAGDFVSARDPIAQARKRRNEATAVDLDVWCEGAEMGLLSLGLDERFGGSGQPIDDEVLLVAELARHLAVGPLLSSILGARVAAEAGDQALAGQISSGSALVGVAELRGEGTVTADSVTGSFDLIDCVECSHALVVTRTGAGLVRIADFGDVTPVESVDPATRLGRARVDAAPVAVWVSSDVDWIWARAQILNSAFLFGLAEAIADLCTEHAKTRIQFGRPIGVHQAIKHAVVDMAVHAESASAQTLFAATAFASHRSDVEFQILAARAVAGQAAMSNGSASIQVHGGMGYTYEHNAHYFLKRAIVHTHLFADSSEVLADLLSMEAAQ
ncbi:acyl-CoA dehydrogenase family protein [Gordonia humi]|uniref:Alkylation response protein AidB-like acyl-CoA dehydrogenase n=1 Tax=Gordonia humi TaxID=686429 RepID=A0A840EZH5_9ACTN|nr:acyl-CoA dehydrogenase family protein [Gordonia humi]MBB4135176.1 alkylation response protein AidB-like acyl-CoA dehydrogenase [Gordonia humi]